MRKIALRMGDGFLEGKGNDFKQGVILNWGMICDVHTGLSMNWHPGWFAILAVRKLLVRIH